MSISGRRVYLSFEQRRFRGPRCGISFVERLPSLAAPGAHDTKRYEEWIARRGNDRTVQAVAEPEGLSWDGVQNMLERVAERQGLLKPPQVVRWLTLDEISLRDPCGYCIAAVIAIEVGPDAVG